MFKFGTLLKAVNHRLEELSLKSAEIERALFEVHVQRQEMKDLKDFLELANDCRNNGLVQERLLVKVRELCAYINDTGEHSDEERELVDGIEGLIKRLSDERRAGKMAQHASVAGEVAYLPVNPETRETMR